MPSVPFRSLFLALAVAGVSGTAKRVCRGAPAPSGAAEVAAGGGHDTNMLLQFTPDPGSGDGLARGWFARTAPGLVGALTLDDWRLEATYSGDLRLTDLAGRLLYNELGASLVLPPLGRAVRFYVGGAGARFDTSTYADYRFTSIGALVGLRAQIDEALRALASYRLDRRAFPGQAAGDGTTDLVHFAELKVSYRPAPLGEIALGGSFLDVVPAAAAGAGTAEFRRARVGPDVLLVWGRLTVSAGGWAGWLRVPETRAEWQGGLWAAARLRMASGLDAAALFDASSSWPPGGGASFSRRLATLGVVAHATTRTALSSTPPPASDLQPLAQGHRLRLRLRAAGATSVRVIGSWDDWTPEGTSLAQTSEPALWERWLLVKAGRHRYRFLVDDKPVRPPDAPGYSHDGFGGEDGVIEVSEEDGAP